MSWLMGLVRNNYSQPVVIGLFLPPNSVWTNGPSSGGTINITIPLRGTLSLVDSPPNVLGYFLDRTWTLTNNEPFVVNVTIDGSGNPTPVATVIPPPSNIPPLQHEGPDGGGPDNGGDDGGDDDDVKK